mmetsp:Transcript_25793/g.54837  ORF Transcript_25793/g.54837 Transcript_25793/m.54837 type:complete len:202 (-) Transcript_25793:338-943(-)
MACLPSCWENKNSFIVFVLHACEGVFFWGIQSLLTGRVRIEVGTNFVNDTNEVLRITLRMCCLQHCSVVVVEHIQRGENKPVKRIIFDVFAIPIDQFVNIVWGCFERENHSSKFHVVEVRYKGWIAFCNFIDRLKTDGLVPLGGLQIQQSIGGNIIRTCEVEDVISIIFYFGDSIYIQSCWVGYNLQNSGGAAHCTVSSQC